MLKNIFVLNKLASLELSIGPMYIPMAVFAVLLEASVAA
jgi:hypothetical protein